MAHKPAGAAFVAVVIATWMALDTLREQYPAGGRIPDGRKRKRKRKGEKRRNRQDRWR